MIFIWILVFIVSLYFLIKGADWFIQGAEKIGLFFGLSPFIIGVTIVALGTSFPELFTNIMAAINGTTEIISANVVGSNIANILLVIGVSSMVGGGLVMTKNIIDIDLLFLSVTAVMLLGVIWPWGGDGFVGITRVESLLLVFTYIAYFFYTILDDRDELKRKKSLSKFSGIKKGDYLILISGILLLTIGAKFLIDSIVEISEIIGISVGIISILAVAMGTSLPELVVSVRAAYYKKPEIALGNVFGSNIFNSFMVIGIPGLFTVIKLDSPTFSIGLPVMIISTVLFIISGMSKKIHKWKGLFFIFFYILFIGKILNIF